MVHVRGRGLRLGNNVSANLRQTREAGRRPYVPTTHSSPAVEFLYIHHKENFRKVQIQKLYAMERKEGKRSVL